MRVLYRTIEQDKVNLADSLGYVMHTGFLIVMGVQVLLCGFWSGLVQMHKPDRERIYKKEGSNSFDRYTARGYWISIRIS